MTIGYAEARRQFFESCAIRGAILDQAGGGLCDPRSAIDARITRRQLWPTAQTRSKPFAFRSGGIRIKLAIFALRYLGGTNRAAIDFRRRDAGKKSPIEARIVGFYGLIATVGIEHHVANYESDYWFILAVFGHVTRCINSRSLRAACVGVADNAHGP